MKIFLLFLILFFSSASFSMTICINEGAYNSCLDEGTSQGDTPEGVNCYYDKNLGVTQCNTVLGDGSIAGYWDEKTFSCSNLVAPVVSAAGDITCPAVKPVTIKSTSTPNPSKDDPGCNPSDPNNTVDCASQDTLIKTNDLISESNSKLGAISGGTAANTGLLKDISETLKGIASQGKNPNCPPPNVSAPSCPDGQVAGYYNHEFTCVSSNGISCIGDACRTIVVSECGISGLDGSGSDSGGDGTDLVPQNSVQISSSFQPMISGTGTCPEPETFNILNSQFEISYQPFCDFAEAIRFIVIALGAFSALLIVVTAL